MVVVPVLEVDSPGVLDTCFAELPMYQSLGNQISTEFTPVRSYESFASDVSKRSGGDASYDALTPVEKKGFLYLVTFSIEHEGMWHKVHKDRLPNH